MFNGSRKSVDKLSGTFKDLMSKINSGSPSKGSGSASNNFDYDQLNDQLEKASLPSPELPSPSSDTSASGGFDQLSSGQLAFNHPRDSSRIFNREPSAEAAEEVLEGFVCPLCLTSFSSPATLQKHYSINHPKQLQEQEIELLRSQVGALMESRDLLKEELARIKSQSEDERLRMLNQMKERESEFFESLKNEKKQREQLLKDQMEQNLISLNDETLRASPTPQSSSSFDLPAPAKRKVLMKEASTEADSTLFNQEVENLKREALKLNEQLTTSSSENEKLRKDLDKLKEAYVNLRKELTEERTSHSSLREGSESVSKEVNKLQAEINNIMDENDILMKEKNNIIRTLSEKASVKDEEMAKMKNSFDERLSEVTNIMKQEIETQQLNWAKEKSILQQEMKQLSDQVNKLTCDLEAKSKEASELKELKEQEIESLKNDSEERINNVCNELKRNFDLQQLQWAKEKSVFEQEIETLQIQVKSLTTSLNEKSQNVAKQEELLENISDELKKAKADFKETLLKNESKCKSFKDLAETARKRSDELTTMKFDLESQLKSSQEETEIERKEVANLREEVSRLKSENENFEQKYDEILHALHELGREHSSLQVQGEKLKSKVWVDDEAVKECTRCKKEFSITTRKHHCRSCLNIFCSECSPLRRSDGSVSSPSSLGAAASLFKGSVGGGTRICEECYKQS